MAIKKSDLYSSIWASCDELRGGMDAIYVGKDEFDGYYAFVFPGTPLVLLENPIEGNAAYIFTEDWRRLSQLTKTELLQNHRHQVGRIFHTGAWRTRLRRILGSPNIRSAALRR